MNRVRLVYAILMSLCVGCTLIVLGVARKTKMKLTSEAFEYGARIPKQYTCDAGFGLNESPPLAISGVSKRAKSLVLIFENPESETGSGSWTHWLVFNLPPDITLLPVGANIESLGGIVGKNSVNRNEYSAICPAGIHSYYFTLYALDTVLDLDATADMEKVRAAMKGPVAQGGHIIAETDLMGRYDRENAAGLG